MNLANLGHDVWVGDWEACDSQKAEFDLIVHVWRHRDIDDQIACQRCLHHSDDKSLVVHWREGEPLLELSSPTRMLVGYFQRPGKLLIHCSRGLTRGPQLGLLALMSRGVEPFEAVRDLYRGLWVGYGVVPHLIAFPVDEIISLFVKRCSTDPIS